MEFKGFVLRCRQDLKHPLVFQLLKLLIAGGTRTGKITTIIIVAVVFGYNFAPEEKDSEVGANQLYVPAVDEFFRTTLPHPSTAAWQ
ncbi:hypothetical protein ZHAS_00014344 [Anopheles sinensis]|uniref:Uncharacterized protein n=1 Tax=Anopheles sinensis TaxID=74873 RepID=A0A084W8A6_ANOSI|nr:hypothetical protein ZHAS_00014344 [Anopheles sinensis]